MKTIIPVLIRRKRMELGWSQENLCRGICAVSYLSKVENGQLEPSQEIERALLEKLGLEIQSHPELASKAEEEIRHFYGMNLYMLYKYPFSEEETEILKDSRFFLDIMLMEYYCGRIEEDKIKGYTGFMQPLQAKRYLQVQLALGRKAPDELIESWPEGFSYYVAGKYYFNRAEYLMATHYFTYTYSLACLQADIDLMVEARISLLACYSGKDNRMLAYKELTRIENLLKDDPRREEKMALAYYNIGAMNAVNKNPEEALRFLNKVKPEYVDRPWIVRHKQALAYEQMGELEKEAAVLEEGLQMNPDSLELTVLKYRLEHPDYLSDKAYELLLRETLAHYDIRKERGFYIYHARDLIQVLESHFRYKEAYELLDKITEK